MTAPAAAGAGIDTMTTGSTGALKAAATPTGAVPNYGGPGEEPLVSAALGWAHLRVRRPRQQER